MIFSRNIIEQVFLTNQKLEMNMPQIFKTKCILNFRKYRSRKKVQIWWSKKLVTSNKIEKTEELIVKYWEVECLWNVLSPSYKDRNLWQMVLRNLSKRFDLSGKLFRKQSLRGIAEKGALKI